MITLIILEILAITIAKVVKETLVIYNDLVAAADTMIEGLIVLALIVGIGVLALLLIIRKFPSSFLGILLVTLTLILGLIILVILQEYATLVALSNLTVDPFIELSMPDYNKFESQLDIACILIRKQPLTQEQLLVLRHWANFMLALDALTFHQERKVLYLTRIINSLIIS